MARKTTLKAMIDAELLEMEREAQERESYTCATCPYKAAGMYDYDCETCQEM